MIDRGVELPAVNQIETVRDPTRHDGRYSASIPSLSPSSAAPLCLVVRLVVAEGTQTDH